ncbi:MAG: hypothetical protein GY765_29875 [bacterium]|nr:hypothetical protein [bacterium]
MIQVKDDYAFQKKKADNVEQMIMLINTKIEHLKTQYNLFFSGEMRVPPESERESLEKLVRNLISNPQKSPRNRLLIQNVSSKFSLYNNMWKKRLNEIESGLIPLRIKKTAYMETQEEQKVKTKKKKVAKGPETVLDISLNREESFDKFYDRYNQLLKKKPGDDSQKEKFINSLKMKLITKNLVDAKVKLSVDKGKLKLILKK